MATKSELIKSLNDACTRILKQSDFAGGVVTALTLVISRLSGLRDQIATAGEIDPNISTDMWNELYECNKVLDSVYCGFPMVPAEDVATLATDDAGEDMGAEDVVNMCATTLEKASVSKGIDAGAPVALVKCTLAKWASLGEVDPDGAKVKVLKAEALVKLAKACGDKKMKEKGDKAAEEAAKAAAPAEPATSTEPVAPVPVTVDEQIAKIDSIAKAAAPAPAQVRKSMRWPY